LDRWGWSEYPDPWGCPAARRARVTGVAWIARIARRAGITAAWVATAAARLRVAGRRDGRGAHGGGQQHGHGRRHDGREFASRGKKLATIGFGS